MKWVLTSFDIKTAFLRGKADAVNPLAKEPRPEFPQKLKLTDEQACALVGNASRSVDAPFLFCKELGWQLKKLGFQVHPGPSMECWALMLTEAMPYPTSESVSFVKCCLSEAIGKPTCSSRAFN